MSELREFATKWLDEYRHHWMNSPYGGPAEPNPTELEQTIEAFIKAFEEQSQNCKLTI